MPRTILLLFAVVVLTGQAPVPRDLPGPRPAPGATPPERIERPAIPRDGVITPPAMPPMPQADVPAERPGTTPVIPPPADAPRGPERR